MKYLGRMSGTSFDCEMRRASTQAAKQEERGRFGYQLYPVLFFVFFLLFLFHSSPLSQYIHISVVSPGVHADTCT